MVSGCRWQHERLPTFDSRRRPSAFDCKTQVTLVYGFIGFADAGHTRGARPLPQLKLELLERASVTNGINLYGPVAEVLDVTANAELPCPSLDKEPETDPLHPTGNHVLPGYSLGFFAFHSCASPSHLQRATTPCPHLKKEEGISVPSLARRGKGVVGARWPITAKPRYLLATDFCLLSTSASLAG